VTKLNGWQRIGVVLSVALLLVMTICGIAIVPKATPEDVAQDVLILLVMAIVLLIREKRVTHV
jgi:hypothetical protein